MAHVTGKLSIAPMMDWTDRHYRYLMRLITRKTLLYTEMVVDQTIIHQQHTGNLPYFLGHDSLEHPLALQLGGNSPKDLADATKICTEYGNFSEINLNVGCPSPKVSNRCFGARLMLNPELVRDITMSMRQVVSSIPITVKCRIGADDFDTYEHLLNFIETVSASGVTHFIVHARKCILEGLSPHENRTIPPLKYDWVYRLTNDFPHLTFSLNGGIRDLNHAEEILNNENNQLIGIMIGRSAYNNPWLFRNADQQFFNCPNPNFSRREIIEQYLDYAENLQNTWGTWKENGQYGMPTSTLMKPLLNLFVGEYGGKAFKRHISATRSGRRGHIDLREMIENAMETCIPNHVLDTRESDTLSAFPSDKEI